MRKLIYIDPQTYVVWAVFLLMIPLDWLTAIILAAIVHEFSHVMMIILVNARIQRIDLRPGGVVIHTNPLDCGQELLCSLAGPAGSMLLILFSRYIPYTSISAMLQGCFNLLPIYPLDGGRALRCGLQLLIPTLAESIERIITYLTWACMTMITLWISLKLCLPAVMFIPVWIMAVHRKKPCKPVRFAVQ